MLNVSTGKDLDDAVPEGGVNVKAKKTRRALRWKKRLLLQMGQNQDASFNP